MLHHWKGDHVKPLSGLPVTTEDTIWVIKKTVYGLKDTNRAFYNLLKKTILSFTSTEKIKFEVGTAEQCLFIARDATGKTVTYIVGYKGCNRKDCNIHCCIR